MALAFSLFGCGSSTSSPGGPDGSTDATLDAPGDSPSGDASGDAAADGGSSSDASSDASPEASGGDGGLGPGAACDMQNDQCGSGLKCCSGGVQLMDAGTGHCIGKTDAGGCPLVP